MSDIILFSGLILNSTTEGYEIIYIFTAEKDDSLKTRFYRSKD